MNSHEIAAALGNATEVEKAEFAQALLDTLGQADMADHDAAKRQVVAALDRFAAAAEGGGVI